MRLKVVVECPVVGANSGCVGGQNFAEVHIEPVVGNLMHLAQIIYFRPVLKGVPFQQFDHCSGARSLGLFIFDEPGGSILNFFNYIDVSDCPRIPDGAGILYMWSDVGKICLFCHLGRAAVEVVLDVVEGAANVVDMSIPVQFVI